MAVKRKVSDDVLTSASALDQGGSALRAQAGPAAPPRVLREEGFEDVRVTAETPVVSVVEAW